MKSSLYVIAALFATASAITTMPEQNDFIDLQVGVEATARANVREMLKANLRAYLERPSGVSRSDLDMWILPGSVPVMHQPSSDPLVFEAVQLDAKRGDAWPGPILPGSEPILPKPSAHIDLQIGVEAQARTNVRETLQQQLRTYLATEESAPVESQLIALKDDDDTVEGARIKAA